MSARTAGLMGRENVPTQFGALIELVKNAYDADAKKCIVYVDYKGDTIWIADDGDGMTAEIMKERWMVIGTDGKLTNPTSRKERVRAGAKGIGRFSLDKLGSHCEMFTKTPDGGLLRWNVNWSNFDQPGAVLTDIKAELGNFNNIDQVRDFFREFSFFDSEIRPCLATKGTLFRITGLRDSWDSKRRETLKQLETLNYPHGAKTFDTYLIDSESFSPKNKFCNYLVDVPSFEDFDYHLHASYENGSVLVEITRNEIDKNMLSENFFIS